MNYKKILKIFLVLIVTFSLAAPSYLYVPGSYKNTVPEPKLIQDAYAASSVENVKPSVEPVRVARLWIGRQYFVRNAEKIATDIAPYVDKNGRTLVPLRFVAYALGLGEENVIWDQENQTVTIKANITFPKFYTLPQKTLKRTLVFKIGSPEFTVDGETKLMDTVPVLVNGRTMLPARFVAENLDYEVFWNEKRLDVTFVPKIDVKLREYLDYSKSMMGFSYIILEGDPHFNPMAKDIKEYSTFFPDDMKVLNSIFGMPIQNTYGYNNLRFFYSIIDYPKDPNYGIWYSIWIYHDYQPGTPQYDRFPKVTLDNFDYYVKPLMAIYFPDNYEEITKKIKNIFINSVGKMPQFGVYVVSDVKHPPHLSIDTSYAGGEADPIIINLKIQ